LPLDWHMRAPWASGWWRLLTALVQIVGMVALLASFAVSSSYSASGSLVPRVDTGQVYELNNHGRSTYQTLFEMFAFYGLMGLGLSCIVASILVYRKKGPKVPEPVLERPGTVQESRKTDRDATRSPPGEML
jgi:hypothetical protein